MTLDQATAKLLGTFAEAEGARPLHEMTPQEARQLDRILTEMIGPGPAVATVRDVVLPTPDGDSFRIRVLTPKLPASVIVYYHGGGWVMGDVDQFDAMARLLATRANATVVVVEYRKAPEHRYPTAVEDAWQALVWADRHLRGATGRSVPLVVAGDSAGGNLAAVMTHRCRDRHGPRLSLQVLIYPVTDADFTTASYLDPGNQLMLDRAGMEWFWGHYADESRRWESEASPLRSTSFSGLPPALVLCAEHDVLRSEVEAYAAALEAAAVPVELELFPGQMHGFFGLVNLLPGSSDGIEKVAARVLALQ